jgi:hypothetical protein
MNKAPYLGVPDCTYGYEFVTTMRRLATFGQSLTESVHLLESC